MFVCGMRATSSTLCSLVKFHLILNRFASLKSDLWAFGDYVSSSSKLNLFLTNLQERNIYVPQTGDVMINNHLNTVGLQFLILEAV
ncbi:CLUMA_CG015508, isoform A [Clunio marinus]|uniref:CLUMA_CG015508, isoform A n=1 Tax=Clunio marinus TaxID=568069 RepID=A0A1J1IRS8_9DIPT|nr:CLUMA_CG015508, isoform A [Clunio marinus]